MSACWNYRAKPSDIHTHLTMYTHSHTWPPTQIQTHARLLLNTTNRQAYNKSLIQLQNHLLIKKSYSKPFSLGLNQNCARHVIILFFPQLSLQICDIWKPERKWSSSCLKYLILSSKLLVLWQFCQNEEKVLLK